MIYRYPPIDSHQAMIGRARQITQITSNRLTLVKNETYIDFSGGICPNFKNERLYILLTIKGITTWFW